MLDLAERIRDLAGSSSEITFVPRPEDDPSVRQPDIGLASALLGWQPRIALDEGLARTVAWFRSHPELVG
jgi:dTDP-glucose 4,6-dehydratase